MNERKRILLLILTMAAIGIVGGIATVGVLYWVAIEPESAMSLGGFVTVNLDEISILFIWAGGFVATIAILVNVVGGLLFFRFTDPIIKHLHESERKVLSVEAQVYELAKYPELHPGPVMRFSSDGTLIYANEASGTLRNCYNCDTGMAFTEDWRETFKDAFQTGEVREIDFSCGVATCGLEDKTFSLLIKPVPETDSIYVFGRDITERKQMEAQLIQSEKMAAIGTMTSGIGHEINNPLYAILGLAEAVRDGKDISKNRAHGRNIIKYAKQISETIKNLSGYIRPSHNHELEPTDVNETISEAVAMVRRSLLSDHIEFKEDLMPLPEIPTKSEEIQQVFFNVIRNGVQAIGDKGILGITSRLEGDRVRVKIQDSGKGISAENMEKIFDPFFTTKDPDEGEGLGLYVVRKIIDKYSGAIAFESQVGKGATCIIEFPVP